MGKNIQLVYPGNDLEYNHLRTGYQSYPPPSGLEIISSFIKKHCPEVKIEIFDGNLVNKKEIIKNLNGEIVGISDWFTNHRNTAEIARSAKIRNPDTIVVVGGANASNLGKRILLNNPCIDFIVCGDGEEALLDIYLNKPNHLIPNIWYRDSDGSLKFSFSSCTKLSKLPIFNFEHLVSTDIEKYDSRKPSYKNSIDVTPVPISSIRGCIQAKKRGPCSYCSIPMLSNVRFMPPQTVWKQINYLYKRYGIRHYFETGDSFTIGNYPEKLLKAKPRSLNISFRIYSFPDSLNEENISVLKKLGVEEIFIGIETINKNILKLANKEFDTSSIERNISLLKKQNIRVFLPFLFGLPGETIDSLNENLGFAKYVISKYENVQRILFSLALPLVGTNWFGLLLNDSDIVNHYNNNGTRSLENDDIIEYERLFLLSLHKYCRVSYRDVYNILKTNFPNRLNGRIGGFGCLEEKVLKLENKIF